MGELFRERPPGDGGRFGPDVLGEPGCGASWIRRRERFYAGALGPMREPAVYHWDDDGDPHVDVYIIGRSRDRPFETLITGGLADRPQPGVPILSDRPRRVEVLLRIDRAEDWAAMILREISTLPFLFGLALEEEGLIEGSRSIRPGSDLRHALLVVAREERGLEGFLVEGEEVVFLRPVFITEGELEFARRRGAGRLLEILVRHGADSVLDPGRGSVL